MKKFAFTLLAALSCIGSAWAGPLVALPVEPNRIMPSVLFRDQELFFDIYGSYLEHREKNCGCDSKHEGFGGGFAVGHYFGYYVGARFDVNFSSVEHAKTNLGGDILLRFPIETARLAPYAFVGGGVQIADGSNDGFLRAGGGLEWRFTPHFGIFSEASYAWVDQQNTANNLTIKAGIRYIY